MHGHALIQIPNVKSTTIEVEVLSISGRFVV